MVVANIVNRNGTTVQIGAGLYSNCVIKKAELTDEYMGRQEYRLTVHSDVVLPVYVGARIFAQETNGAGGFVMLAPPTIDRRTGTYYIYDLIFCGFAQQLEGIILFNQDVQGFGWETNFSLYGTARDFVNLICTNMNRSQPTDSQLELWKAGTVDATGTTLITFDNDNCLTALKKVSDTFGLPYQVLGEGGFHEYWVGISITNRKRRHTHTYDIGNGLASIKTIGESDRKFTTALCALGATRNIPYNYRGGLKRLRCGSIGTSFVETVYDEFAGWTPSEVNEPAGVTTNFYSTTQPKVGSVCTRITSAGSINASRIRYTRDSEIDVDGASLRFWVSGGDDFFWEDVNYYFDVYFYSNSGFLGTYRFYMLAWQLQNLVTEQWIEIVLPLSAVSFSLGYHKVKYIEFGVGSWSQTPNGATFGLDNIRFDYGYSDNTLQNFIIGTSMVETHGRLELIVVNDNIYPQLDGEITSVGSQVKFRDSNMPFDLNAKDGSGNTIYLIDGVTPKINFVSGNLSGFSLAIHSYNNATKEFELVPYTEESGNVVPAPGAYSMQVGDKYNITEINLPEAYIEAAEQRLYAWALEEYEKYSSDNLIADVAIDHVWLYDTGDLYYEYTDAPGVESLLYKLDRFFMAGDLVKITVPNYFDRELLVQTVVQTRTEVKTTYQITLAIAKKPNITGDVLMSLRKHSTELAAKTEHLAKYFDK